MNTKASGKTTGNGMDITLSDEVMRLVRLIARCNAGFCIGRMDEGGRPPQGYISPEMSDERIREAYKDIVIDKEMRRLGVKGYIEKYGKNDRRMING